jgi:poly(hydroxyalkanoate) depolymerase family esterase
MKMDDDFATAMRRSLEQTRAGNPAEATRLIQAALAQNKGVAAPDPSGAPRIESGRPTKTAPRRPLSSVIEGLARRPAGLDLRGKKQAPEPDVPEGASFERHRHEGSHGARDYRLYKPSVQDGQIRGVVVMLHGCTQSPEDFAVGTRMNAHAERHGLIVVYPEQTRAHNPTLCWNWFRPSDQGRSGGEAALVAELAGEVAARHDVAPGRVFAAGLSAGGAMAAILVQTHPEVFSAAGVHSGLAPGSAQDVVSAFGAMRGDPAPRAETLRAPAIIFHGSADSTVAPVNAGRLAGKLADAKEESGKAPGRRFDVLKGRNAEGHEVEVWRIDGAGHAWAGGDPNGSYTDPSGPDASAEMIRFFLSRG